MALVVLGVAGGRLQPAQACDIDPGSYDFLSAPRVSHADSGYVVLWDHDRGDGEIVENTLETRPLFTFAGDLTLGPLAVHARLCDRVIGSSGDRHLVVGTAQRTENSQPVSDIVTLILDPSGTATGPATTLTSLPYLQRTSGIAFNGDHFLVVGEGSRDGATILSGQRLDRDGRAVDDSDVFEHSLDQYVWVKPRVASARGQFLVAWTVGRYSGGDKVGLYAVRISEQGEVLDRQPLFEPASARVNAPAALASSGTEYFAVWADEEWLWGARITTAGMIILSEPLAAIGHPVFSIDVAWTGTEYVVTWTSSGRIRAIRVSAAHTPVASEPVELTEHGSESATTCGPTDCVTAWTEWKGGSSDIVALHLQRKQSGAVELHASEIVIAEAEGGGCSIAGPGTGSAAGAAQNGLPVALALLMMALAGRRSRRARTAEKLPSTGRCT
jgi:hypothetical protein